MFVKFIREADIMTRHMKFYIFKYLCNYVKKKKKNTWYPFSIYDYINVNSYYRQLMWTAIT